MLTDVETNRWAHLEFHQRDGKVSNIVHRPEYNNKTKKYMRVFKKHPRLF